MKLTIGWNNEKEPKPDFSFSPWFLLASFLGEARICLQDDFKGRSERRSKFVQDKSDIVQKGVYAGALISHATRINLGHMLLVSMN